MTTLRKNQHLVAKFAGSNGDLVVGRIDSVRSNGHVTGLNLLTNSVFAKQARVLETRNSICTKRDAERVVRAYQAALSRGLAEGAARSEARRLATTLGVGVSRREPVSDTAAVVAPSPIEARLDRLEKKLDRLLLLARAPTKAPDKAMNGASAHVGVSHE